VGQDWVEATVRDLERWAHEHDEGLDVDGARILLELAQGDLELTEPAQLRSPQLRTLLLEVFPDVVMASPDDVPGVLATSRGVVDFLVGTGAVPPADAIELRAELDRIGPEFTELIAATDAADREAAAEVLAQMMRDDDIDVTDDAAVERWIKEFEALPEEERFARTAGYLPEVHDTTVPPVHMTPLDEVARAARESGLLERIAELAEWVGERPVKDGRLAVEDAVAAVADLEWSTPRWDHAKAESARDIPELERLWQAAAESELVVVADGMVRPGPGGQILERDGSQPDPEAILGLWLSAFDAAVTPGDEDLGGRRLTPFQVVRRELPGVLIQLYEQDEPSTSAELFDTLMDHVRLAYEVADEDLWETVGDYALTLELEELAEWGVIAGSEDGYELTPLGVWGIRELLLADGYTAPVVGELAERPAEELISGLAGHREATADDEIDLWLARRSPEAAAGELIDVIAGGAAGARTVAAAVLHRVGPDAEPVVRTALEEPVVRPYATLWLQHNGDTSIAPGRGEMQWIFADTVAGMLETEDPAEAVAAAVADAPTDFDLRTIVEEMWRLDHPDVADVLGAIGSHHPDKDVAKAARKGAFKARSKRTSP
jgi:hypothetical protein